MHFIKPKDRLIIRGIPDKVKAEDAAICRSRLSTAVNTLLKAANLQDIHITIDTPADPATEVSEKAQRQPVTVAESEISTAERARRYETKKPLYTFDQLVVSDEIMEDLLFAIEGIQVEAQVFDHWGLRKIEPYPRNALNLHGPPGTGKTLAAHAIADKLKKDILVVSYAEIESKYVGDGPKNIKGAFLAAENAHAVLFIDEADALLSKRLTNVTQGAEQAINSMRNQLFLSLDQFRGIIVFATNLVENYDRAFETRVRHIRFLMPDERSRCHLWKKLLVPELPLKNVYAEKLAVEVDDICGRDIKNAIIYAAVQVARQKKSAIEMQDLLRAIQHIKATRVS